MHMPVMVDLKRVTVFGGERGEGLQKTQKLALFADELLVVPEAPGQGPTLELPAGAQSEVKEKLLLPRARSVPVHPRGAGRLRWGELRGLIRGRTWVVSDLADRRLNERIKAVADAEGVLCTVVDTKDLCSAWFMGLIKTDHLTVAVSSGGTVSFYVPRLREALTPLVEERELEASVLAEVRRGLDRAGREEVLADLFADSEFRRRVEARIPYDELLDYARRRAGKKVNP